MLEFIALLGLLLVAGVAVGLLMLALKLVALTFKVVLIPVKIGFRLLFGLAGLVAVGCLLLVLGPVALVVLIALAIPMVIIGGLVWGAVALVT
jgi:hypothetical protein